MVHDDKISGTLIETVFSHILLSCAVGVLVTESSQIHVSGKWLRITVGTKATTALPTPPAPPTPPVPPGEPASLLPTL
jgi:hypothetical protein